MSKYVGLAVALVIALLASGCSSDLGSVVLARAPADPINAPMGLQSGDRIKVTVYGEDSLNGVYDVDPTGNVTLPLAGTMKAEGRTRAELQRAITARYRKTYLQDPQVSVEIVSFRPFYVMGEVKTPGAYSYKGRTSVLSAIATAGGLTYRASRSKVLIQHPGAISWNEYPLTPAVMVEPGDLIRVPERYF